MHKRNYMKITLAAISVIMLLLVPQAAAWGDLTHYSINRDAGKNSAEEVSAGVAPDALLDLLYRTNNLDTFVHLELPGILYGPLGYDLHNVALNSSQQQWAIGWIAHTTAERAAHGTYLPGSPYLGSNNYVSAAGADTLLKHLKAEFGGDILSYWLNQGTRPTEIIVYQDQLDAAFADYDSGCGTDYSDEYDPDRYLKAFEALQAAVYAEQVIIDSRQDKRLQFTDWLYLIWAYNKYHVPYETYYPLATGDVSGASAPSSRPQPCIVQDVSMAGASILEKHGSNHARIKMEVGKKLIEDKLLKPQKKLDKKTGAITISFEQEVNEKKLTKAYERYLDEAYKKQTGEKVKILSEIKTEGEQIIDVEADYPDLYQKLIRKGVVRED